MTSPIGGVSPLAAQAALRPVTPTPAAPATAAGGAAAAQGPSFAGALQEVSALQRGADSAALGVATGQLTDLHQLTVATSKASLAVEVTAALRDRAVEAYSEVMRMQV